jgi:purine-binding chemotaxis protein CheW
VRRLLLFTLDDAVFAVNVGYAVEVLRGMPVKHVPELPDFIEGVVEIRGRICPVMDMRRRLGMPVRSDNARGRFLIVRSSLERVALLVDEVVGVETVRRELIRKPPLVFRGIKKRYMEGLYPLDKAMLIILSIEQILTSEEMIRLQKAVSAMEEHEA